MTSLNNFSDSLLKVKIYFEALALEKIEEIPAYEVGDGYEVLFVHRIYDYSVYQYMTSSYPPNSLHSSICSFPYPFEVYKVS